MKISYVLLLSVLALGPLAAQNPPTFKVEGTNANDRFGFSLALIGDVNADGFADFAVGAPGVVETSVNPAPTAGYVKVFSGKTGLVIYTFTGPTGVEFGYALAGVGDINQDQVPDIAVGVPRQDKTVSPTAVNAGAVSMFSGKFGTKLYDSFGSTLNQFFGSAISDIGDYTGQTFNNYIVGSPGSDVNGVDSGLAQAMFGSAGIVIKTLQITSSPGIQLGSALANGGLVFTTMNSQNDVVVSAPFASPAGRVYVFDDLVPAATLVSNTAGNGYGTAVDGGRDFNGDGRPDVVVGSPLDDQGGVDAGRVQIITSTGVVVRTLLGAAGDRFGSSVAVFPDDNGDGVPELAVGAPGANKVTIFSGANGSELRVFTGGTGFGSAVVALNDYDNNGYNDVLIGSSVENNTNGAAAGIAIVDYWNPLADPILDVDNLTQINRSYQPGGPLPASETRLLMNTGATPLDWHYTTPAGVNWVRSTPAQGTIGNGGTSPVSIDFDVTGLTKQVYSSTITFENTLTPGNFKTIKVVLDVKDPLFTALVCPVGPASNTIPITLGEAPPADIAYQVTNCGNATQTMHWQVTPITTSGGDWLQVDVTGGTVNPSDPSPTVMASIVQVPQLTPGIHAGVLRFTNDDEPTDVTEVPFTLVVDLPIFDVGATLIGSIDFPDDQEGGGFIGIKGMTLQVGMTVTGFDLKPYIAVLDQTGAELKRWKLNNAAPFKTIKKQIKLPTTGTYSILIGGLDSGLGSFELSTARKLPGKASFKTYANRKPKSPLSFVEIPVRVLPGATLNVNATPHHVSVDDAFLSLITPTGAFVDISSFSFVSSDILHLISVPLDQLGDYRIRVSGLVDPEDSVTLQIAPFQPEEASGSVNLD